MKFYYFLILLLGTSTSWTQSFPATHVYSDLSEYSVFASGQTNKDGYQILAGTRIYFDSPYVPPGLLVQLDHDGYITSIDTLREYSYDLAHRVDSFYFLSGYHYNKQPDTLSTYIFEICDLNGNVIQSYEHDFVENIPFSAGVVQKNDSVYIFSQACEISTPDPLVLFYEVNTRSLEVKKTLAFKGSILSYATRIDDKPTFLDWAGGLWIKDTTFTHTNKILTDTTRASYYGTILPREDKPGWFGFGSCITPVNFYGICMIALDENLALDKVDLLYHPPSGDNWYLAATFQPMCKSEDAYYGAGLWNDGDPSLHFWNGTTPTEIVIAKYDLQLNRVWTKIVGGDRRYMPVEVHPTVTGGFMIAGGLRDNLNGNLISPFTMFLDADGELVGQEAFSGGRYEFTIYGNPGRDALRIKGQWSERQARLTVVDVLGRTILTDQLNPEEMHTYDTSWWPSCTYFLTITDESGRALWSQPWIRE